VERNDEESLCDYRRGNNEWVYNREMQPKVSYLRWIALHLLVFTLSPFSFMLAGLLVGVLVFVEPYIFGVSSPVSSRLQPFYNQTLYLLAPLLSGGMLGALTGCLQIVAMRKLAAQIRPGRWIFVSALGMALAFLALAWAYNASGLANPLPLASIFSGSVYGLAASLPQSRFLKKQFENAWGWILACTLAGTLSFALICASAWVAEGNAYFGLIFLLSAVGGIVFGAMTGGWVVWRMSYPTRSGI